MSGLVLAMVFALSLVAPAPVTSDDILAGVFEDLSGITFDDPNFHQMMLIVVEDGLEEIRNIEVKDCEAARWANHTLQLESLILFLDPQLTTVQAAEMLNLGTRIASEVPENDCP